MTGETKIDKLDDAFSIRGLGMRAFAKNHFKQKRKKKHI